jgi:hypothetical protein
MLALGLCVVASCSSSPSAACGAKGEECCGVSACNSGLKCTNGKCKTEITITVPTTPTAPSVTLPYGLTWGGSCSGDVYIALSTGYAFCDNGVWAYTVTDPKGDAG